MIDEISKKCEDICDYLDDLSEEEQKEIVNHYFGKYLNNKASDVLKEILNGLNYHAEQNEVRINIPIADNTRYVSMPLKKYLEETLEELE